MGKVSLDDKMRIQTYLQSAVVRLASLVNSVRK